MNGAKIIGQGWSFPPRLVKGRITPLVTGEEKIRQSIWLILSTAPGERQMRPEFGCGIHDLVFQPNTSLFRSKLQEKVHDALLRWEPRIDVIDVRVEAPPAAKNHLLIRIDYRIRTNNSLYNLVYPYYIQEGAS